MGVLGLSLEDVKKCSIEQITLALAWHRAEQRQFWEMTQMLSFYMVQPYDSKNKIKTPIDLFKLPWQSSPIVDALTPEKIQARKEKFAKWDKKQLEKANGKK